jgi:hypothetical protein
VGGRGKERTRVQSKWRSALHSYLCVGDNHDRFPGRRKKKVIRHHNDDTKRPRTHMCVMDGRTSGHISEVNPKDHPT